MPLRVATAVGAGRARPPVFRFSAATSRLQERFDIGVAGAIGPRHRQVRRLVVALAAVMWVVPAALFAR